MRRRTQPLTEVVADAGAPAPDGVVDRLGMAQAVRQGMKALPARQRLAITLRYGEDLTEVEVAEALGCRPGSAAALLSRARSVLRESPALAVFGSGEG
jgi:RNA polymerase sigma factor (sigma-70 family)